MNARCIRPLQKPILPTYTTTGRATASACFVSGDSELPRRRVFSEVWSGGIPTAASVTVGCEALHPARNIHHLVGAFPPGPQYHPKQPYMKEDDENA